MNVALGDRVREVVANTFGLDPAAVDLTASNQTLAAWSSLAHLRLVANLEQAFGVRFSMAELTAMTSVQAIEQTLAGKGVEG